MLRVYSYYTFFFYSGESGTSQGIHHINDPETTSFFREAAQLSE